MTEYKVWAFARSAVPNLTALENQLEEVMREADKRGYIIVNSCMEQKYGTEFWRPDLFVMLTAVQQGRVNVVMVQSLDRLSHDITILYRILRFLQNYGAVLITTETNLQYELYLTGLESRILARAARTRKRVPWEVAVDAD
jgi:DNA invertase Pin-like site-specific DNA recombinase